MSTGIAARYTGTLLLILITAIDLSSQDENSGDIRIMFYNVENLFDTNDDPGDGDNEFLPGSLRRWSHKRYAAKVNSIGKVIIAAGGWEPPALVAMCEVENRKVLEDLVYRTAISKYNYSIVHEDSHDSRGIDIGLIYRPEQVSVPDYRFIPVKDENGYRIPTRDILVANVISANERFVLLVNHWPSRRGGLQATEGLRKAAAITLRKQIDSIFAVDGRDAMLLVMGDFNAGPGDSNILIVTGQATDSSSLQNLTGKLNGSTGTYKYQGLWETIDQVFVSRAMIDGTGGLVTSDDMLSVMTNDFLLTDDLNFPGRAPFSTWSGYRYKGGYSDHLPIVIVLRVRIASLPVQSQAPAPF